MPAYRALSSTTLVDLMSGVQYTASGNLAYDWSDANVPWAYSSTTEFTEGLPATTIVDIQTGSTDFYTNLVNTVNAAGGRCVVRLGVGTYSLKSFRKAGSGSKQTYAFGFFIPNLQGLLGQGPDQTFVQMDANSMSQVQLDEMATMTAASFEPLQMGVGRIDGTTASPGFLGGLTVQAADQQLLTAKASDLSIFVPQPAPHNGIIFYQGTPSIMNNVRFRGAARSASSAPPFESGQVGTQYGNHTWRRCEFDGRRAASLDPARPRRCGAFLINNEDAHTIEDSWIHHTNVSRYATNDENRNTQGLYTVRRCKSEQITNTKNTDPALNGGASLGGWTNATPFGWESCNGTILVENSIITQDNSDTSIQWPAHLQLTSVGSRNPQGGRMTARNNVYRNTGWAYLDGYLTMRIATGTYWWMDGFNTTIDVRNGQNVRLAPYTVAGTWPPSQSELTGAGVTPQTHFLIRRA